LLNKNDSPDLNNQLIKAIFEMVDGDRDGKISYEDLKNVKNLQIILMHSSKLVTLSSIIFICDIF
jgi:Ca2+-binding EF-hand superfamily protein